MIHVTRHARKRMRQRIKLSPRASERLAARALERGFAVNDVTGRLHQILLDKIERHGKGHDTRIYGGHVFVFEQETLITTFTLPPHMRQLVARERRKAKRRAG